MSHAAPTPPSAVADATVPLWRRPRATRAFLLTGLGLWLFLLFVPHVLLGNDAIVPAWILLGAGLAAGTLLFVMARRLQPGDGVTVSVLLWAALVGGFVAIALGSSLDSLVGVAATEARQNPHDVGLFAAGLAEELAKIVAVVVVAWRLPVKTARGGLFVGGAVGVGFAVLENLWYIGQSWAAGAEASEKLPAGASLIEVILVHPAFEAARTAFARTVFDPVGHPLWTALFAAAVFAAARNGRFRLSLGVVGAYLGVALMHGLWDGNTVIWALLFPETPAMVGLAVPVMVLLAVASAFLWRSVVRRINAAAGVTTLRVPRREQPRPTS
ncbi:PrsW family intramembrane metalloprotease [Plantibacter flavus]|uniref:PrsW family glutamic-type intramembrane protease n=1 Tax=Plantibacter flavus TaxID=150123 RepID=UPI003F13D670